MSTLRTRSYSSRHVNQAQGSVRLLERIMSDDLRRGDLSAARRRLARVEELVGQEVLKPRELASLQLLAARLADAAGDSRQTDLYIGRVLAADWLLTGETKETTDRFCARLALNRGAVADARHITDRLERIVTVIPAGHGTPAREIIDEDLAEVSAATWLLSAEVSLAEGDFTRAEGDLVRARETAEALAPTPDDWAMLALLAALVRVREADSDEAAGALVRLYRAYVTNAATPGETNNLEAQTLARIRAACGRLAEATTLSPAEAERWGAFGARCALRVEELLAAPDFFATAEADALPDANALLDLLETALGPAAKEREVAPPDEAEATTNSPRQDDNETHQAANSLLPLDVSLEHTRLDSITSMFDLDRDTGTLEIDWSSCDREKIGEAIMTGAVAGLAARVVRGQIYFNDGAYVDARFESDESALLSRSPVEVIYELFRIALCRFPLSRARQLIDDPQASHRPERTYQRPNNLNLHIAERIDALRLPEASPSDAEHEASYSEAPQLSDHDADLDAFAAREFFDLRDEDAPAATPVPQSSSIILTPDLGFLSDLFASSTLAEVCAALHRAISGLEIGPALVSIRAANQDQAQAGAPLASFGDAVAELRGRCEGSAGPLLLHADYAEATDQVARQKLATMTAAAALHLRSLPGAIDRAGPPEEAPVPFIAADPETHKLLRLVREFAALDGTTPRRRLQHLMIVGERGVGKELIAQALHRWSGRHDRPFRAVNMSRINPELAPAEIFGARKGGYTGATADRRGLIQQFAGGTLFLDEIDEAGDKVQAMLKRVVEYGTYERVGDPAELRADVRFIVATNRVAGDTPLIKEDLRDRFWEIRVPPLRERRGDVRPLAVHFARRYEYVLPEPVLAWLESPALDWPGNIRQLQTIVERACSLAHAAGELTLDLFHQCVADGSQRYSTTAAAEDAALREGETLDARLQKIEKTLIEHALDETRGNKTQAAEKLGGTRQWLYKRCQALGIKR